MRGPCQETSTETLVSSHAQQLKRSVLSYLGPRCIKPQARGPKREQEHVRDCGGDPDVSAT